MATQYWVGDVVGGDNWSNVNAWANISGGAGGTGTVPVAGDTTYFDAASLRSCTVDVAAATGALDCTGFAQTLTLAAALAIDGATFALAAGMTFTPATFKVSFVNSAAAVVNITSAGQALYDVEFGPAAGNNGTWKLLDACTVGRDMLFTRGTLQFNGMAVSIARDLTLAATCAAGTLQPGASAVSVGRDLTYLASGIMNLASCGTATFTFTGAGGAGIGRLVNNHLNAHAIHFYNLVMASGAGDTWRLSLVGSASCTVVHQLTAGAGTVEYDPGWSGVLVIGTGNAGNADLFKITSPTCSWKLPCTVLPEAAGGAAMPVLNIYPANYDVAGNLMFNYQAGSAHDFEYRLLGNTVLKASGQVSLGVTGATGNKTFSLNLNGFNLGLTAPNVYLGGGGGYVGTPRVMVGANALTVTGNLSVNGTLSALNYGDPALLVVAGGSVSISGNFTHAGVNTGPAQDIKLGPGDTLTVGGDWNSGAQQTFREQTSYNGIVSFTKAGALSLTVNALGIWPIVKFTVGTCTLPAGFNVQQLILITGTLTTAGTLTIRELYNGSVGTTLTVTGDFFVGSGFATGGAVITAGASLYTTSPLCSLSGFNPTKVIMGRNTIRLQLTSAMNIGKLVLQGQRHAPGILQFKAGSTYAVGDLDSELDMPDCPVQFISSVAGTTYALNVAVNSSTDYIWPRDCALGGGASPITGDITNKDLENNSGWNLPGKGIIRVITDDPGQDTMALGDPGDYQFCWLVATSKAALTTLASDFANGHHNWHRRTYLPYAELDALAIGTNYFIGLGLRNSNDDRLAPNIAAGDYIERYAESSLGGGAHSIFSNFQTPVV